jgi:hypothetical protein
LNRPVVFGSYVVTLPAVKSPLGRVHNQLAHARVWVWKILAVFAPGATLPPNNWHVQTADVEVYEAQLFHWSKAAKRYKYPRVVEPNSIQWLTTERSGCASLQGVPLDLRVCRCSRILQEEALQARSTLRSFPKSLPGSHKTEMGGAIKRERERERDRPLWDTQSEACFLKTPAEREGHRTARPPTIYVPRTGFLRPENIIGSGFRLTCGNRLPRIVQQYLSSRDDSLPLARLLDLSRSAR